MKLFFLFPDGTEKEVEASVGLSVMEVATQNDIPGIPADCGGSCACATCHVHVSSDWLERLPDAQQMEHDMLDFAEGVNDQSRLSCQIMLTEAMNGMRISIPAESL